jgi:hypothetical protein
MHPELLLQLSRKPGKVRKSAFGRDWQGIGKAGKIRQKVANLA